MIVKNLQVHSFFRYRSRCLNLNWKLSFKMIFFPPVAASTKTFSNEVIKALPAQNKSPPLPHKQIDNDLVTTTHNHLVNYSFPNSKCKAHLEYLKSSF